MSYQDDQIRTQRNQPKLTPREIEAQKKMLKAIVEGNKKRVDQGVKLDETKQTVVLKDGLKYLDRKIGVNQKDADKKMQAVVDYYKAY